MTARSLAVTQLSRRAKSRLAKVAKAVGMPRDDDGTFRLPYAWEISDWLDKYIFPLPEYDVVMLDYLAHPRMTSEWWDEYHKRIKTAHPYRNWLHNTLMPWFSYTGTRYFKDPYWKLQHRFNPKHRYHMINTGLRPGYADPDIRLLWGIMNMVEEYVDYVGDKVDWNADPSHAYAWKVQTEAVEWWKRYKELYKTDFANLGHDGEQRLEEEADDHLAHLMRVRRYMWYP